jgi:hypothetical protein
MALKDLIIDQKQISEKLLERILKDRAHLIKQYQGVNLTKIGNSFSNKTRILLFLCGKKAWEFLTSKEEWVSITDIEKNLSIKGNTLRPLLKVLKDSYEVESAKGKYRILSKGIFELEKEFEQKSEENANEAKIVTRTRKRKISNKKFSRGGFINGLCDQGFFKSPKTLEEVKNELERAGIATKLSSLPPYLLPLVRRRKLTREKVQKGKKRVWVYKSN